ncbi:hypothetical protein ACXR2T_09865 [Leucobacter sp. HY1910]
MAATKASKSKSRALALAQRDAEAAQRKADELKRVAAEIEAEDLAMERALKARGELAGALYDVLGLEPEPKREMNRTVLRRGKPVQEPVFTDRDPKEVLRAQWAFEAVELMAKRLGDESMAEVMQTIEQRREAARKTDDAKRANKGEGASAGESVTGSDAAPAPSYEAYVLNEARPAPRYANGLHEAA